jgi:hypothetical protein
LLAGFSVKVSLAALFTNPAGYILYKRQTTTPPIFRSDGFPNSLSPTEVATGYHILTSFPITTRARVNPLRRLRLVYRDNEQSTAWIECTYRVNGPSIIGVPKYQRAWASRIFRIFFQNFATAKGVYQSFTADMALTGPLSGMLCQCPAPFSNGIANVLHFHSNTNTPKLFYHKIEERCSKFIPTQN